MARSDLQLRIESNDPSFGDFYQALALELGDVAMVYLPFRAIPPNARYSPPPPQHLILELRSADAAAQVIDVARDYLSRGGRSLRILGSAGGAEWGSPQEASSERLLEALKGARPD